MELAHSVNLSHWEVQCTCVLKAQVNILFMYSAVIHPRKRLSTVCTCADEVVSSLDPGLLAGVAVLVIVLVLVVVCIVVLLIWLR